MAIDDKKLKSFFAKSKLGDISALKNPTLSRVKPNETKLINSKQMVRAKS